MIQLAILSDTHGKHQTVETVLEYLQSRNINRIIHCGDIDDSETVWLFQCFTVDFVFGHCDVDRLSLQQAMHGIGVTCHQPFGHLELEGKKLAFLHSDDARLMRDLEQSDFDYLFYGHTHVAKEHQVGETRVINPGALHRANPRSFLILDLPSGDVERVSFEQIEHLEL